MARETHTPTIDAYATVRKMRIGEAWTFATFRVRRLADSGVRGRTPTERVYTLRDSRDRERVRWGNATQIAEDVDRAMLYDVLPPPQPYNWA